MGARLFCGGRRCSSEATKLVCHGKTRHRCARMSHHRISKLRHCFRMSTNRTSTHSFPESDGSSSSTVNAQAPRSSARLGRFSGDGVLGGCCAFSAGLLDGTCDTVSQLATNQSCRLNSYYQVRKHCRKMTIENANDAFCSMKTTKNFEELLLKQISNVWLTPEPEVDLPWSISKPL